METKKSIYKEFTCIIIETFSAQLTLKFSIILHFLALYMHVFFSRILRLNIDTYWHLLWQQDNKTKLNESQGKFWVGGRGTLMLKFNAEN